MSSVSQTWTAPDDSALAAEVLRDLEREPMGLYEVWYSANSLYPGAPMSARVAAAERVIRLLAAGGRVNLWRGRWIGPQHDREAVSFEELAEALLVFSTWAPEDGDSIVWMELTAPTS